MKTCWVITNGTAGTVSQALGLALSIGFKNIVQKVFKAKFSFSLFPPIAHIFLKSFLLSDSDRLEAPWPDVVIGCGRRVIPFLLYIKKASCEKTFCIYVQDPRISSKYFDIVIKMHHDPIEGPNVISTDFSLNLITKEKLSKEVKDSSKLFSKFSKPYYTIAVGGDTKRSKMNKRSIEALLDNIRSIIKLCHGSVFISTSRRTPDFVIKALVNEVEKNKKLYLTRPDSKEKNLYFAMLGLADKIFVTNDSVNMISEACASGKPVYVVPLFDMPLGRTKKFFNILLQNKLIKIFDGKRIEKNIGAKINNNKLIAAKVKELLPK
jgi:mitochondrial fission protein ELM1